MKKFKKILAAALVTFTVSAFVFTGCDTSVPADEDPAQTEQTAEESSSGTEQTEAEKTSETEKTDETTSAKDEKTDDSTSTDKKSEESSDKAQTTDSSSSDTKKAEESSSQSDKTESNSAAEQKTDSNPTTSQETPAAKEYTVTFDKADGSTTAKTTSKVKENEKAVKPADPKRDGYTFDGWFADNASKAFDFDTTITADLTLTAKWTANAVAFTLYAAYDNGENAAKRYTEEQKDTVQLAWDIPKCAARIKASDLARLYEGAKIYFTASGDGAYRIDDQDWHNYAISTFYDASTNQAVQITKDDDGNYTNKGNLYFVITNANLAMFTNNVEFHGAAIISDAFYVNGEAPAVQTGNYKEFTDTLTKDISDASILGFKVQIPNTGSKDENGDKLTISGVKIQLTIGTDDPKEIDLGKLSLAPDPYEEPVHNSVSNIRVKLGLSGSLASGTQIKIKALSGTVDNEERKNDIVFVLQEDGPTYDIVTGEEGWHPLFSAAE